MNKFLLAFVALTITTISYKFALATPSAMNTLFEKPADIIKVADRQHQAPEPQAELIIDGNRRLYEVGLFRIIDPKTGYVIYIYRPNNESVPSSIDVVPLNPQDFSR